MSKEEELKSPKERDNLDLLELVCQLHSRALNQPRNKQMHNTYIEARKELESRLNTIDEYADEVSRERVVKFMIYAQGLMFSNKTSWLSTLTFSKSIEQLYDKWKSNQEEQL